jgi:uncharacterized membrane protein YuzA (DUF378 family)
MNYLKALALLLVIVGGLNWLLVGLFQYDLVASLTGSTFGEINTISTVIYVLVGVSAIALVPTLLSWLTQKSAN